MSAAALAIIGDYVPFGIGQALGRRAGGNSLDNTLRVAQRVPTDWVLADIRVHAVPTASGTASCTSGPKTAHCSAPRVSRPSSGPARRTAHRARRRDPAMTVPQRYGITFPFDGIPLVEQGDLVRELADLGYTDLWSAESGGHDAFTPLAARGGVGTDAPARHRDRPRVHARARTRSPRTGRVACARPRRDGSPSASARRRT